MVRELCTGIGNGIFVRRMEWNGPRHLGMPRRTLVGWLTSRSFPVPQEDGAVAPVRFRGTWSLFRESTGRGVWPPLVTGRAVVEGGRYEPIGGILCGIRDGTGRDGTGRDGTGRFFLDLFGPPQPPRDAASLALVRSIRRLSTQPNPTFSSETSRCMCE